MVLSENRCRRKGSCFSLVAGQVQVNPLVLWTCFLPISFQLVPMAVQYLEKSFSTKAFVVPVQLGILHRNQVTWGH
jgi:hypothetical protein